MHADGAFTLLHRGSLPHASLWPFVSHTGESTFMAPRVVGTLLALSALALSSCSSPSAAINTPAEYSPTGQTKCKMLKSSERPLIVEWPATDRSDLESLLSRGLVAIRYTGCEVELLRNCASSGRYDYKGTTRETEREAMRSADELYAKMPIGAAKFEAMVERGNELTVSMTIVGKYLADRATVSDADLQGEGCERATHVVTGLSTGAFEFYSESQAAVGADAMGLVGGKSSNQRELLRQAGDQKSCEAATRADTTPPNNCGALLRMEVARIACSEDKVYVEGEGCQVGKQAAALNTQSTTRVSGKPAYAPMARYLNEIGQAMMAAGSGKPIADKWRCRGGTQDLSNTEASAIQKFAAFGGSPRLIGTGIELRLRAAAGSGAGASSGAAGDSASEPPYVEIRAALMSASDGRFRLMASSDSGTGQVEATVRSPWVDDAPEPYRQAARQLLEDMKTCSAPWITIDDLASLPIPEAAKGEGASEVARYVQKSRDACELAKTATGKWRLQIDSADIAALVVQGGLLGGLTSEVGNDGLAPCLAPMRVETFNK
jgi:hypothetical protein